MRKYLLLLSLLATLGFNAQIYVSVAATGNNNGTSWQDAYSELQDALNAATDGDEIWIKYGNYIPNYDTAYNNTPSDPREKTFYIKDKSIAIYGGFQGNETSLSQRDPENWITNFDGDIGVSGDNSDNCYQVLFQGGDSVIIDGIMFTNSKVSSFHVGGYVGALSAFGKTIVNNCKFIGNAARRGAGICVNYNSEVICHNSVFQGNGATEQAGAIYGVGAYIEIANCLFEGNSSAYGGAVKLQGGMPTRPHQIVNSIFSMNNGSNGGAVQVYSGRVEVRNCTMFNNTGNGHAFSIYDANQFDIYNSIVWSSSSQPITSVSNGTDVFTFTNCIVDETVTGSNNISQYPMFSDSASTFKLTSCSPARNAGDNQFFTGSEDYHGNVRFHEGVIDIGAVEYHDPEIASSGGQLYFVEEVTADNYQWYDCSGQVIVSGATSDIYTPSASGNFSLIYTYGNCTDTTDCLPFVAAGLNQEIKGTISLFPNPTNGAFTISSVERVVTGVEIYNLEGRMIYQEDKILEGSKTIDPMLSSGVYVIKVICSDKTYQLEKLVIK